MRAYGGVYRSNALAQEKTGEFWVEGRMFGGRPGHRAETILNPDGAAEALGSKEVREIHQGDVVSYRLAGGGGYGDPRERDPVAICEDIADGYVSKTAAAELYDVDATELD